MRVVLLSHGFQPEYELGMANGLASNGIEVTLVASDDTLHGRLNAAVDAQNLRGSQDPHRSRLAKAFNMLRYIVRYWALVAKRSHEAVHIIGMYSTANAVLGALEIAITRLLARRLILTVHNVLPHDGHTPFNRWVHRLVYALPHELVVHTAKARLQLIQEFDVSPPKVHVMEHGIERFPVHDDAAREEVRGRLGLKGSDTLVLFFGNLSRYKGLDLLIDAIGRPAASGLTLLIAGRCRSSDLRSSIQQQIESSARRESMVWWDRFIPDEEVAGIFFAADVLAMPYRHIDQSGVLFMAMSTGLPVVATDVGSLRHYVERHAGSVVEPENATALVNGLLAAGVPLSAAARRALAVGSQAFDWRVTVRSILTCYAACTAGSRRSA